jgi:hypothetical protein
MQLNLPQFSKQKRPCDGCTACCNLVGVAELGKPERCNCEHQIEQGCSVYGQAV